MPKPVCITCNIKESLLWRVSGGGHLCNHCYTIESANGLTSSAAQESETTETDEPRMETEAATATTSAPTPTPKSAKKGGNRWTRSRSSAAGTTSTPGTTNTPRTPANMRGRGRRSFFKKTPFKAPSATATIVTSDSVYYNVLYDEFYSLVLCGCVAFTFVIFFQGNYMQIGDIVSMIDEEGDTYYAQIRGFMTDQYCEKSAVVTWLLPTKASPPPAKCFDPATYIIGKLYIFKF